MQKGARTSEMELLGAAARSSTGDDDDGYSQEHRKPLGAEGGVIDDDDSAFLEEDERVLYEGGVRHSTPLARTARSTLVPARPSCSPAHQKTKQNAAPERLCARALCAGALLAVVYHVGITCTLQARRVCSRRLATACSHGSFCFFSA